jgi:4-amino-4-deoxy-L-arabinose transferase-like glycosyltransferase
VGLRGIPRARHGQGGLGSGVYLLTAVGLLAAALALRLAGIDDPSIEQRETQSALLARRWSVDRSELTPAQQRVMTAVDDEIRPIEPPILDAIAAAEFRLTGSESLWFPRLVSAALWVLGGLFLLLAARRLTTAAGALVALALYLFWPYAVWHSRLFMPDSLLVCALLAATWTVLRYWEVPSGRRFAVAAATSSFATLVKPGIAFLFLVALFMSLALARGQFRRVLRGRLWLYALVTGAAAVLYGVWGLYLTDVIWEGADDSRFETGLLVRSDFWHGWWDVVSFLLRFPQEQSVLAVVAIALGLAGMVVAPRGVPRATLVGLAVGYLLFVLAFANYTSTHPYYSLPLIPILALALGVLAGWVLDLLEGRRVLQGAVLAVVAAAVVVAAQRAYTALTPPPPTDRIAAYREIGELTGHTTRSIIVDPELGTPAMYWGWIATRAWEIDYLEQPPAWIEPDEADYLIVVDTDALESHAGLRAYVAGHPVVARTDDYAIFDLRA